MVSAGEKDPVPEMMKAAWDSVSEMLMEDELRWKASAESPVAKSSDAAAAANGRQIARETLGLLVHAAMEYGIRAAFAQKLGAIQGPQLHALMQAVSGFSMALVNNVDLTCTGAECTWKGKPADAGPMAECPVCSSRCAPKQGLIVPAAGGMGRG